MVIQTSILTDIDTAAVGVLDDNILYLSVGTGTTTPDVTDTTLETEVYREAVFLKDTTSNTITSALFLDVTEAVGSTITEIGAFNSSSGGTMVSRNLTTSNEKTSSKEFYFDIKYTVNTLNN